MMRSMTGFGKADYTENKIKVSVEIQSVNGRFLDLKTKLPRILREYENNIKTICQRFISRGRVFLTIFVEIPDAKLNNLNVDFNLAEKYVELADEMAERFNIENRLDSRSLLTLPDILRFEENNDGEDYWGVAEKAVIEAFEAHRAIREQEGAAMGSDVSGRLDAIMGYIDEIEKKVPEIVETNIAKFREKIERLIDVDKVDENRLIMEAAIYSTRVDITEECVRFKSHNDLFADEMKTEQTSGKKLSFLLQEMNREANTITSKVMAADISQIVVRIKEELEKMREMVENIE
ncbi:YicC/YloC family endoribonuclease [Candidatus Latescibacterota bacterium]